MSRLEQLLEGTGVCLPDYREPDEYYAPIGILIRVYLEGKFVKKVFSVGSFSIPFEKMRIDGDTAFFDVNTLVFGVRYNDLIHKIYE